MPNLQCLLVSIILIIVDRLKSAFVYRARRLNVLQDKCFLTKTGEAQKHLSLLGEKM